HIVRLKAASETGASGEGTATAGSDSGNTMQWTYTGDAAQKGFGQPRVMINFTDRFSNGEYFADRGSSVDLTAAQQKAIQRAITQPDLKAPRQFAAAAPAAAPVPAAPAAPVVVTQLKSEALRNAITEFKAEQKNPYPQIYASTGEYVTATGETFVPVMLYIPKAACIAGDNLTFSGTLEA